MKINLSTAIKGYNFGKLFSIGMSEFEIDALLPVIFYLIRCRGKQRGKGRKAIQECAMRIEQHVNDFANHRCIEGFDDIEGRRLADKWIRTSMVQTSRVGRTRKGGEQIFYVRPLSFLSYKPAFPVESTRLRGVPQFLYQIFHQHFGNRQGSTALTELERRIQEAFAVGLEFPDGLRPEGYYDGRTPLDTEVLAQIYYLDGFEASPHSRNREPTAEPAILKRASGILADDIHHFMLSYKTRVPSGVLARYLIALLNFELAIYTLKLVHATNAFVRDGQTPEEMASDTSEGEPTPPTSIRFYVDVTSDRHSPSGRMAHASVNRDLEALQEFCMARLVLRTLDLYVQDIPSIRQEVSSLDGAEYLTALLAYRDDPDVRASIRRELRDIGPKQGSFSENEDEDAVGALPREFADVLQDEHLDELTRLLRTIELHHGKQPIVDAVRWYSATCGIRRDDGFLVGNLRGQRVWYYQMSDLLLEVLVQLCAVLPEYNGDHHFPRPVPLNDFLDFLEHRYGVLIASPPEWLRSTEHIAAAKRNFVALKHRLRQMGLFVDLSDDFNAQRIKPRYERASLPEN